MAAISLVASVPSVCPFEFVRDKATSKQLWNIRKGLFPALGYAREAGQTIIIEDVAKSRWATGGVFWSDRK